MVCNEIFRRILRFLGRERGKFWVKISQEHFKFYKMPKRLLVFEEFLFEVDGSVHYEDCAWITQQRTDDEQQVG